MTLKKIRNNLKDIEAEKHQFGLLSQLNQPQISHKTLKKDLKGVKMKHKKIVQHSKNNNTKLSLIQPQVNLHSDLSTVAGTHIQTKSQDNFHTSSLSLISITDQIKKPNYVKIDLDNIITGYLGHSCIIFQKAIIQGFFYFQIKMLNGEEHNQLKFQSGLRVGICSIDYSLAIPLGRKNSFGYCHTGQLISDSKRQKFGDSYTKGDIIGIAVNISPLKKNRKQQQFNPDSSLSFYKNGVLVGKITQKLTQQFYHFALSLYNYAKVQVITTSQNMHYKPVEFEPLEKLFTTDFKYKDLQNTLVN